MAEQIPDLFLSYNHKDEKWVKKLANSIESEKYGERNLRVFLDEWDIVPGKNMIKAMENGLETSRYVSPIISKNSIDAEWPNMEWCIAISSDPSGKNGRVIPIWLGGCEIPPSLMIRNVLFCDDDIASKRSYNKLIAVLKNQSLPRGDHSISVIQNTFDSGQFPIQYEDNIQEQLAANIFPIIYLPKVIWYGTTNFTNGQIYQVLNRRVTGVLPTFISKEGKVFCFWDLTDEDCPFIDVLSSSTIDYENVNDWLRNEEKSRWLVELLNKGLKNYCENLGLRFDRNHRRYSFMTDNNKDREVKWNTGKRKATRTVVKKHIRGKSGQSFWSHQSLEAKFIIINNEVFLQLIPGWIFTLDGLNPLPSNQIGPLSTKWTTKEHNPSVLYHIRFWASYLSEQSESIVLPLGKETCQIDVTPVVSELNKGLVDDLDPIEKVFEIAAHEIQSTDELRELIVQEGDLINNEDSGAETLSEEQIEEQ